MTREELGKIIPEITEEQLRAILDINTADIGNAKRDYNEIKAENDNLKSSKDELETKITTLLEEAKSNDDYKSQLETLKAEIEEKEEADKKAKADAQLTEKIIEVFGDKKFTSDYAKNGVIADMKLAIAKDENKGKGYAELFAEVTRDKEGIFENANPPADMTGMGSVTTSGITKEQFAKMGYRERNDLYNQNKELYEKLRSE